MLAVFQGPFAHVGSIVANLFSRLVRSFQPIYANESRSCELLAAGCAVGVACTFSAPVGGDYSFMFFWLLRQLDLAILQPVNTVAFEGNLHNLCTRSFCAQIHKAVFYEH